MEEKINIAEILKDKPQETKLYDYLHNIDIEFNGVETTEIETSIWCTRDKGGYNELFGYSKLGTLRGWLDGLQILLPSKEMRDWSKFAWKKGDVLSCGVDNLCIFEKWANKDYTEFKAIFATPNYSSATFKTEKWSKETNEAVIKQYISNIEKFKGGKLNLATLEIEKQSEFKDGDIVYVEKSKDYSDCLFIYKEDIRKNIHCASYTYILYDLQDKHITINNIVLVDNRFIRLATDSEKQQLFKALAKENKTWDTDKKMIIDLKQKVELKPFDKVLVRDDKEDQWSANIFSYQVRDMFHCLGEGYWRYCIPYEGNEHLLGTTKDVED